MAETVDGLMTQAAYAKRRGVSRAMISRYFRNGRLVLVDGLIDAQASDQKLAGSFCGLRGGKRAPSPSRVKAARPDRPKPGAGTFLDERTRREKFAAQLLEAEYRKTIGELVEVTEVNRALSENLGPAIERLRSISARLGARIAAESDVRKCSDMIDAEVDLICQEIADNAQALIDGFGKRRQ